MGGLGFRVWGGLEPSKFQNLAFFVFQTFCPGTEDWGFCGLFSGSGLVLRPLPDGKVLHFSRLAQVAKFVFFRPRPHFGGAWPFQTYQSAFFGVFPSPKGFIVRLGSGMVCGFIFENL